MPENNPQTDREEESMRTNMKRLVAWMLALLMMFLVPAAFGEDVVEGTLQPSISSVFRDKLKVTCEMPIISVGETTKLTATENYKLVWTSSDNGIATVDENGVVTGISAGTVKITATEGEYSDTITLIVLEGEEEASEEDTDEEETESEEPQKAEKMMIVITSDKEKITYDGEEHPVGYTAISNSATFDETKVEMINPEKSVLAKDCGLYQTKFEPEDFVYDGSSENVEFVVSNGWLQIKPATVTVQLGSFTKTWGEPDPDFSEGMVVEGLCGDDTVDMLNLQIVREEGEADDFYAITLADPDAETGNYRLSVTDGVLVIEMPQVKIRSSMEGVEKAKAGTEVVLTAEMEGLDTERFNIKWQMGDTPDVESMKDIDGANGLVYTYILDESTAGKYFRVLVELK
jgi:hypothetical protein